MIEPILIVCAGAFAAAQDVFWRHAAKKERLKFWALESRFRELKKDRDDMLQWNMRLEREIFEYKSKRPARGPGGRFVKK